MGYYISTLESTVKIHKDNLDEVYELLCRLNKYHSLKTGGTNSSIEDICKYKNIDLDASKSISKRPDKWFSGMPWNYDEICSNAEEILRYLGFLYNNFDEEYLHIDCLSQDTGCEELFLDEITSLIEPETYIIWRGEYGEIFVDLFKNETRKRVGLDYSLSKYDYETVDKPALHKLAQNELAKM